ncbi:VWA domain-containing protein [Candidatus Woesearchaeota archaeon]|nr:VWA domain-containing protein [Candidatus Woesearchaeota archaeon]
MGKLKSKKDKKVKIKEKENIEELSGNLKKQDVHKGLMNSVLENDQEKIDQGKLLEESINQGLSSFTPDLMFERLVKNFKTAKQIFGASIIRQFTGYDPDYIEKNAKIPEFQRDIKKRIQETFDKLKFQKLVDREGLITDKGIELASLVLYTSSLDNLIPKGLRGEKVHKKHNIYGDKNDTKMFKKGDRYKDIAIRQSVKNAIRRNHSKLSFQDLKTFSRRSKGEVCLVYALDSSGSMKGSKVSMCKRAGVALAYKAIQEKDSVGLITFGSEVKHFIRPTKNFGLILREITRVKASSETNFPVTINKSIELFPGTDVTKHLLLISDALPTTGENPEKDTLAAVSIAKAQGITVSLVGINVEKDSEKFGQKIAEIGGGKFYLVKNLDEIGKIVLEDYQNIG